jgi:hypothetical protein
MNKKLWIVIGGLLAVLLVFGAVGATAVYAQGPNPPASGFGRGHGHQLGPVALEAAAKALDMTTDELQSALQSGKTLQELADAAGVKIEDVRSAIEAARVTEMRDRITQAVAAGQMTQEKANWLLEGLDKGYVGGGEGFGFGMRGPRGMGNGTGNCPMVQPAAQTAP